MFNSIFSRRRLLVWAAGTAIVAAAPASAMASTSSNAPVCVMPALSQPFASLGDHNSYALVPGESVDSFNGTGWTLHGGARIVKDQLADGKTGYVLQLPPGSSAVSPAICAGFDFPTIRMEVRTPTVYASPGVNVMASYLGTYTAVGSGWDASAPTTSWQVGGQMALDPDYLPGWQQVVFTLTPGNNAETDIYDLYIDPRMH